MSGEKTEEATPKRKRQAREDGDVARSAEFTGVAVMLASFGALVASSSMIVERLMVLMRQSIRLATRPQIGPELIGRYLLGALGELALALAPVLAVAFVAAGFFTYVQIGALFTIKPLIPDMKRLNAAQNLKNLVGKDKLVELVKNLAKLGIMTCVGYAMISDQIEAVIMTPRGRLAHGTAILADAALRLGAAMIGALVVFGLADLLWQRHRHAKKLRMSKDEVKREYKQSEGDPQLKGKRRQLHQQLINDPGTRKVPDADAVVVNPTHVAVALRYRKEQMRAPKILAAGKGEVARQIKWLARRHQIPIVRNVPLARGLVEVGADEEIPEEFYEPVAEILKFVYELRTPPPHHTGER